MSDFPDRVTLFDDGVYRWSYELDMWHNRYLLKLILKILCLVLGIPTLVVLAMLLWRLLPLLGRGLPEKEIMARVQPDRIALAVVAGIFAGCLLLTLIIYAVCAAVMGGVCRLRYEMDESAVALVRRSGSMDAVNALGVIAILAGLASNQPDVALQAGSTLAVANNTGTTRFDAVRRVKVLPAFDLLDLREWFGMNQIYVPREDYEYVRDFILARVSEKARMRSQKEIE